jgi:restriction endonuclease Mrr
MARRRRRASVNLSEAVVRFIVVLALIAYTPLLKWWNSIPEGVRFIPVILLAVIVVSGIGLMIVLGLYRKQHRTQAWQKAMNAWQKSIQSAGENIAIQQRAAHAEMVARQQSACYLSADELEVFAGKLYSQMGYRVKLTGRSGDHGIDVRLLNPQGQVEIVQCKQWHKPVGEPQVRDLLGAMSHTKAVQGWLWAPGGFSAAARKWAKNKPIELVDDAKIGQLLEIAYRE